MPSDRSYEETKSIKLGETVMNPDLVPLADFIEVSFGIRPINIFYDISDGGPRLNLCLEFEHEQEVFYDPESYLTFDRLKQQLIAMEYRRIAGNTSASGRYMDADPWVYCSAFAPIARKEANAKIPDEKISWLKQEINHPDIWHISRAFEFVTFFFYTDHQLSQYDSSAERTNWTNQYFEVLKPYDQFGYFVRDEFRILLDSKENFDKNYQSNWYYYYK